MTALREEMLGMRLLKVAPAYFVAGDLRGNRQNRDAAAMAIVKPIDQMQIPGTTTSGAHRQAAGQMRFRSGGEGRRFLVTNVHPMDLLIAANGVRDPVQRIAGDAVDPLNSRRAENIDELICYPFLGHKRPLCYESSVGV